MPQESTEKETWDKKGFVPKSVGVTFDKHYPRFWNNSINKTYFFNVLGLLGPGFERLFLLSVLTFRKRLKGSTLEQPAAIFMAQEAQHDHQIKTFNETLERQHQYPMKRLETFVFKLCKQVAKRFSPELQLAMTVGGEHIVAVFSDFILRDAEWLEGAEHEPAMLWRWHAVEEIEHKAVVYDIYQAVCGSYALRIGGMLIVSFIGGAMWLIGWAALATHDKQWFKLSFWKDFARFLFLKPGFLRSFMMGWLKYFKPNFHPKQIENSFLTKKYRFNPVK